MRFNILKHAWKKATSHFDREHVVPYIIKNKLFKILGKTAAIDTSFEIIDAVNVTETKE